MTVKTGPFADKAPPPLRKRSSQPSVRRRCVVHRQHRSRSASFECRVRLHSHVGHTASKQLPLQQAVHGESFAPHQGCAGGLPPAYIGVDFPCSLGTVAMSSASS